MAKADPKKEKLLMQVLQGRISTAEAKKAWKAVEKAKEARSDDAEKWPFSMTLPCRRCTDLNGGVEVSKPVSAFTTAHSYDDIWKQVVSKGQDLCCARCRHQQKWGVSDAVVPCDSCGELRSRRHFDPETLKLWQALSEDALVCLACKGDARRTLKDGDPVFCNGECQRQLPE